MKKELDTTELSQVAGAGEKTQELLTEAETHGCHTYEEKCIADAHGGGTADDAIQQDGVDTGGLSDPDLG